MEHCRGIQTKAIALIRGKKKKAVKAVKAKH